MQIWTFSIFSLSLKTQAYVEASNRKPIFLFCVFAACFLSTQVIGAGYIIANIDGQDITVIGTVLRKQSFTLLRAW